MLTASWRLGFWFSGLLLLTISSPATAQQNDWITDYTWARSLAATTGRPLLLCVGGPTCVECMRLHLTTFRDPGIAATVAQWFVALKLDAEKDAATVQAMGITRFPVVVLAAPDGIILHSVSGYADAPTMARHLEVALTRLQQYRGGIRPGSETPGISRSAPAEPAPVASGGRQTTQSYYGPTTSAPAPQGYYWYGSPYGGQGTPAGTWSSPYLSSFPDYFGTQRRC